MGKKSKSKHNKVKKVTKPVVNKIDNDEASLDDVETSVIEEVVEVQNVEENTSEEQKSTESEWMSEYNSLLVLREDEKKIRSEREEYLKEFMKEHEKKMKEFSSVLKKNKRDQDNSIKKMKKLHTNEVKKASKEKRKRNGKSSGSGLCFLFGGLSNGSSSASDRFNAVSSRPCEARNGARPTT